MKNNRQARGDELVEQILNEGDDGRRSNELLAEIFGGYPVEGILPLLQSSNNDIARAGAFITVELGTKAKPLIPELSRLLSHTDRWVRSDIVDTVLLAAGPSDGQVIADAVALVNDPDQEVRRKAFGLLAHADQEQLEATVSCVSSEELARLMTWLLELGRSTGDSDHDVEASLKSEDRLVRWFAVVVAIRIWRRNPVPLARAVQTADEDLLREFAKASQDRLQKAEARAERRRQRARQRD